jgi:glyoxylase-like metal-dependent hydrolase (beta-lactamase superfamily II)
MANAYVLLSDRGKALLIDYGYDFRPASRRGRTDVRRPWLYTLPKLRSQFGVTRIDAAILTHYHDDHVAGCNLLRDVEGAQVWAAENFADILQRPDYYDLPCLWYDPIPVDRVLPLDTPFRWEEYTDLLSTARPYAARCRHRV